MLRSIVNVGSKEFVLDKETGEVLFEMPEDALLVMVKKRDFRTAPFVIAYQSDLCALGKRHLKPTAWRMLMYCMAGIGFENCQIPRLSRLAEMLEITRQHAYKLRKQLVQEGLIKATFVVDGPTIYELHPSICWRGSVANLRKKLQLDLKDAIADEQESTGFKFNGKCLCGSSLHTEHIEEYAAWEEAHTDCEALQDIYGLPETQEDSKLDLAVQD